MIATCPHCQTEYDADDGMYGRFVKCAVCGKGFVAGTSGTRTPNGVHHTMRRPIADDTANVVRDKVKVVDMASFKRGCVCATGLGIIAVMILLSSAYGEKRKEAGKKYVNEYTPVVNQEEIARTVLKGVLVNVRNRYRNSLSRYGLTESYYDETSGICDLMLLDVGTWTKCQIVYYRSTGQIEWPRMMPKSVAEDLMHDRMLIDSYEKISGK